MRVERIYKMSIEALEEFAKGGPYYGPRGGKWADPQHKIPWSDRKKKPGKKKPTKAKEEKIPSLRHWVMAKDAGLPSQTINKYKGPNGYTPERKQLHSAIIRKFVDHVPTVPSDTKPVAIVMMGGGGAGKGTVVRHVMGDEHDFVNVNSDDCKEELPEYQQALDLGKKDGKTVSAKDAAWMAHEESSDIAEDILQIAIGDRKNLIMDGTGKDAEKYQGKIQRLKDAGYHVRVMMPHITLDEAKRRADMRAEHTGRYVPHEILEQAHHLIPGNFEAIAKTADEFALFDNGGRPPRPVWSFNGEKETVLDEKFVGDFKQLGKQRHEVARAKGWMKSLLELGDLRKGDMMKVSLSMDEMLKRMETPREEVLDSASMLDDFSEETESHLYGTAKKSMGENEMNGIDALNDFAKGGPYIGPKGGKWADPQHKIPWDARQDKTATKEKRKEALGKRRGDKARQEETTSVQSALKMLSGWGSHGWKSLGASMQASLKSKGLVEENKKAPGTYVLNEKGKAMAAKIKKSEGIDEIMDFAKGSLPSGEPKMGSGEEEGGKLDGKGKTSGSGDSASGPAIAAPVPGKDKFSEDDEDEKKAMKEHKKPLEQSTKSFRDTTPQGQRDAYALEHARRVAELQKGETDVHVGVGIPRTEPEPEPMAKSQDWTQGSESRVVYSRGIDDITAEMAKSDSFYHGQKGPSLSPEIGILHQRECSACGDKMSKALTACPHCGEGTTDHGIVFVDEGQYVDEG